MIASESADSSFTWEHFAAVANKDLADVLGNFVNRITKFCAARFDGQVPGEGEYGEEEKALAAELDRRVGQYSEYLEQIEFRKALGGTVNSTGPPRASPPPIWPGQRSAGTDLVTDCLFCAKARCKQIAVPH